MRVFRGFYKGREYVVAFSNGLEELNNNNKFKKSLNLTTGPLDGNLGEL